MSRKIRTRHLAVPALACAVALALACLAASPSRAAVSLSPNYVLDANGTSHVAWPFPEPTWEWSIGTGSLCHETDDYYALDLNWGTNPDDDEGKLALAMAPGYVIFAGQNFPPNVFTGYGKQVVVQIVNQSGNLTSWAYRYAHLNTIAVSDGDYVHFGSEIGTVGDTGTGSAHLHAVLYKDVYNSTGGNTGIQNLNLGYSPGAIMDCVSPIRPATLFAAPFAVDGLPFWWNDDNLPCSTWNGDAAACDAHSIPWGGEVYQDCAYYACSGRCAPRGTSNCLAGCEEYCSVPNALVPCHTYNGDVQACDAHALPAGHPHDCAYYLDSDLCRPRGTSNCLAGITSFCFQ